MKKKPGKLDRGIQVEGLLRGGYRFALASLVHFLGLVPRLELQTRSEINPSLRIIRYRRIVDPLNTPYPPLPDSYTTPDVFYSQIRYLSRNTTVISLPEVSRILQSGEKLPDRSTVIIFDRGYRDAHDLALPILREFSIPGATFIATAFIDSLNLMWRDKIIAASLFLEQHGVDFPDIPGFEDFLPANFSDARSMGRSMARLVYLIRYLERASLAERRAALGYLGVALENLGGLPLERQFLSWNEAATLNKHGWTIGLHGHGHCAWDELRREASESGQSFTTLLEEDIRTAQRLCLERGIPTSSFFAFPDDQVVKEGREVLFKLGFSWGLAEGKYPLLAPQSGLTSILGYRVIPQDIGYCPQLFACHLWDIKFLGMEF